MTVKWTEVARSEAPQYGPGSYRSSVLSVWKFSLGLPASLGAKSIKRYCIHATPSALEILMDAPPKIGSNQMGKQGRFYAISDSGVNRETVMSNG